MQVLWLKSLVALVAAMGVDAKLRGVEGGAALVRRLEGEPEWIDDGSNLSRAVNNTVFVDGIPPPYKGKVNAQYTDGVVSGTHYWVMDVQSSKMAFGLTSAQSLDRKNFIRGYFYNHNGNLKNGAINQWIDFGPSLVRGDQVGMLVEFTDVMSIWFFVNGVPRGLAFKLPLPSVPVYPTVSFKAGNSWATISRQSVPLVRDSSVEYELWSGLLDAELMGLRTFYSDHLQYISYYTLAPDQFWVVMFYLMKNGETVNPVIDHGGRASEKGENFIMSIEYVEEGEDFVNLIGTNSTVRFGLSGPPPIKKEAFTQ